MTYDGNSDVEGGRAADERTPMIRGTSEAAKPKDNSSTLWKILHFLEGDLRT